MNKRHKKAFVYLCFLTKFRVRRLVHSVRKVSFRGSFEDFFGEMRSPFFGMIAQGAAAEPSSER